MNMIQRSILILVPLAPYLTNLPVPDDSASHWSIDVAAGLGQMADVSRTCEGDVISVQNYHYTDVAAAVRYTEEPFTVSVSGGTSDVWTGYPRYEPTYEGPYFPTRETKAIPYCVPMVGIDSKYIGLEVGWLTTFGEGTYLCLGPHCDVHGGNFPAGAIRLGNREKLHFSAGIARNLPLVAGGGLIDIGLVAPMGETRSMFFYGLGVIPYDGIIFSMKGDLILNDRFTLTPRLSVKGGDAFEYGLAIGGRAKF
jgi:hypothetical protein